MTIADKLMTITDNMQRVFDAGYLEGQEAGGYNEGFDDGRNSAVDADKIIEATATGKGLVHLTEVSEVKHKVKVTTTAGAKVTTLGKNLLSDAVKDSDNWVRVEGISINSSNSKCYFLDGIPNGTFTVSAKANSSNVYLYFFYSADNGETWQAYNGGNLTNYIIAGANAYPITFTKTDATRFLFWHNNINYNKDIEYIQVEAGSFATEYAPYITPTAYTADSNGIALVDSIAPNMTVITDGEMTAEYRKSWGMKAERDAFWKIYQDHGNRTDYTHAFAGYGWTYETYHPKYPIRLREGWTATSAFQLSLVTDTQVPIVCEGATTLNSTFYNSKLKTIRSITSVAGTVFQNTFYGCADLENISFSGIISNDIDLHWSTKLSRASINSLIWICNESQGYDFKVTLSIAAVNKAFETSVGANDGSESDEWYNAVNYSHQNITLE